MSNIELINKLNNHYNTKHKGIKYELDGFGYVKVISRLGYTLYWISLKDDKNYLKEEYASVCFDY